MMDSAVTCPQCDGYAQELGDLGDLTHYRCRRCGWTFHLTEEI